jgi:RimJ/RimL family protein N-acetyltransferase
MTIHQKPATMPTPVLLRPPRYDDVAHYAAYLNDPQVTQWLEDRCQRPVLFYQAQAFVLGEAWCRFAIEYDGRFVGMVGLEDYDPVNATARFFIVVGDPAAWNKGVGTAAAIQILDHGFRRLGLRRITSNYLVANGASRVVHERAGFVIEGCQRQTAWRNGAWVDQTLLAVLRDEWQVRQTS